MLLDHSLQDGQLSDARSLILFPPVRIETKGGKRAIDARLTQKLVAIGCLNGRYHHQTDKHQHSKTRENRNRRFHRFLPFTVLPAPDPKTRRKIISRWRR